MRPLGKQRLSQHIVSALRQKMLAGELQAGDRLPTEAALCETFAVSRTTLREAIQALRDQGLVDVAPGRGTRVCAPHPSQLASTMTLAATLMHPPAQELACVRLALLRSALPRMNGMDAENRAELGNAVVSPHKGAEENAAAEETWHMAWMRGAGMETGSMLMQAVLAMDAPHRLKRCASAAYAVRTQQIQMRLMQAIGAAREPQVAERLLGTWLEPVEESAAVA